MLYAADRPVLLVCDDTVFVKMLPELKSVFGGRAAQKGVPYPGAKELLFLILTMMSLSGRLFRSLSA